MRCPICGSELVVVGEYLEARTEDGVAGVYAVFDLACSDEQCSRGRMGLPVRRVRRPVCLARPEQEVISCCGAPLLYLTKEGYWIPDGVEYTEAATGKLTVICSQCARSYLIDVERRRKA